MKVTKQQIESLANVIVNNIKKNRQEYNNKINTNNNRVKVLKKLYNECKPIFKSLEDGLIEYFTLRIGGNLIKIDNGNLDNILEKYTNYQTLFYCLLELKSLHVNKQDIIDELTIMSINTDNTEDLINKLVNKYE